MIGKSFSELQTERLYGPSGFYEAPESGPGRGRDYLTSPELGSVFAECLAVAIEDWWTQAGRPDPFVFVEAGAGRGTLARQILAIHNRPYSNALQYIAVERSAQRRSELNELHDSRFDVRSDLPDRAHVIFANELLDNICVDIAQFDGQRWQQVLFDDQLRPAGLGRVVNVELAGVAPGAQVPIQNQQFDWVTNARAIAKVVAIDYARSTREMASLHTSSWLRTYSGHSSGVGDITCDVATDQLPAARITTQKKWLCDLGIQLLEQQARATWEEEVAFGSLDSIKARSRLNEISALTDPEGLGDFKVMTWDRAQSSVDL